MMLVSIQESDGSGSVSDEKFIQFNFIHIKSQQHSPQGAVTCVETMRKANVI